MGVGLDNRAIYAGGVAEIIGIDNEPPHRASVTGAVSRNAGRQVREQAYAKIKSCSGHLRLDISDCILAVKDIS